MHVNFFSNGDQDLHCSGCGAEIELESHYSKIIGERLNRSVIDISTNAASNDRIVRTTIDWFESGNTCDIALIHLSEDYRTDYPKDYNQYDTVTPEGIRDYKFPKENYGKLSLYYKTYFNTFIGSDNFYKNQFLLEQYFENHNIPYYMMCLYPPSVDSPWKDWVKHKTLQGTHYKKDSLLGNVEQNPSHYHHHHPSELGHHMLAQHIIDNIEPILKE